MSPNTKKCPNSACGRENGPSEIYCIDCGDELDSVSAGQLKTKIDPDPPPPKPNQDQRGRSSRPDTQIVEFDEPEEIRLIRLGSEGHRLGAPYVFRDRTSFTIGREQGDILILTDKQVSKVHARVAMVDTKCYVENLGDSNGVFLRLRPNEVYDLQDGDELLLASEFLLFRMPPDAQEPPPPQPAPSPQPDPRQSPDRDDFVDGGGQGTSINISDDPVRRRPASSVSIPGPGDPPIGRGGSVGVGAGGSSQGGLNSRMAPKREFKTEIMGISDPSPRASVSRCYDGRVTAALYMHLSRVTFGRENCTFNFPGGKISRQHAEIVVENGRYMLKDLGSQNGTFVRIQGSCMLRHEDQFRVGSACFQLLAPRLTN